MKRNGFKFLALTLCLLMVPIGNVSAVSNADIAGLLEDLSIINGYPDGELRLEQAVTRAEFSKIVVAASPYRNQVASGMAISPFSDVSYNHWAAPYVKLAVSNGLVTGYPDASFRPEQTVLLEEAVTVMLRLLGYTNDDFGYSWPYGQIGLAQNIGLMDNVTAKVGTPLVRGDVMLLAYNLLTCSPKGSNIDYLEGIQYKLVEDIILIATNQEDSSVQPGRIATSGGSFKIEDDFNSSYLGQRGNGVLKNGDTLTAFIPYAQSAEEHVVYSKLGTTLVTYRNGDTTQLVLDANTIVYRGTQQMTYSTAQQNIEMGDLVTVQRDSRNHIEYITLRDGQMEGPITVRDSSWLQMLSVDDNATVMRNGEKVSFSDIKTYDVVYYSADLNMVLEYSKKVTGIYESASPNKDQLTAVTISGVSYEVDSAEAFNALASGGRYSFGDTVTVLLGKDDTIVGIASSVEEASIVGYFYEAGVKEYENQAGDSYSNYYVTVIGTDGQAFTYAAKRDYSGSNALNSVVRVSFTDGLASVASYKRQGISGDVDAEARYIGNTPVADSATILDVVLCGINEKGSYATVFLQQMDDMDIANNQVLYYEVNGAGQITKMILNDVTGECYEYGIITEATSQSAGMSSKGSYTYDAGGKTGTVSGSTVYQVEKGQPVMLRIAGGRVETIKALSKLGAKITDISSRSLTVAGGKEYRLSDSLVIYKKINYDYIVMPLSELSTDTYSMTAYYDKAADRGGRIRVIVAEEKNK